MMSSSLHGLLTVCWWTGTSVFTVSPPPASHLHHLQACRQCPPSSGCKRGLPACLPATAELQLSSGWWALCTGDQLLLQGWSSASGSFRSGLWTMVLHIGSCNCELPGKSTLQSWCQALLHSGLSEASSAIMPYATCSSSSCRAARIPTYAPDQLKVSWFTHVDTP